MVSVDMITFNHEKFISQAIEGVLMQKTKFRYELVIGEDCSSDNTSNIVKEYAQKYPDIIKARCNVLNMGMMANAVKTLKECTGKYIALCEGDDYWTDPYKLQKQVDFLEANPNYSLCFHDAIVYCENKKFPPYFFCKDLSKTTFHVDDVIKAWLMPSASIVFRKDLLYPLPSWFKEIYNGDYALQLLLILKGKFYFIDQLMSVYRQHETNLSATVNGSEVNKSLIQLFKLYDEYTNNEYSKLIKRRLKILYSSKRFYKIKSAFIMLPFGKYLWQILSFIFRVFKKR